MAKSRDGKSRSRNSITHKKGDICDFGISFEENYRNLEKSIIEFRGKDCRVSALKAYEWLFNFNDTAGDLDSEKTCFIQSDNRESNRHLAEGQKEDEIPEGARTNKPNPIVFSSHYHSNGKLYSRQRILFRNDWKVKIKDAQKEPFAITNLIAYYGNRNRLKNAGMAYGLILDLDGIDGKRLQTYLQAATLVDDLYPLPNIITLSGTGVHFYYAFEHPVNLTHKMKPWLRWLKYCLIYTVWNQFTSIIKEPQFQGINQGFRVIGGRTKVEGLEVLAFDINMKHKWELFGPHGLASFVNEETEKIMNSKVQKPPLPEIADADDSDKPRVTWEEAQQLWPEWAEKVKKAKEAGEERIQTGGIKLSRSLYDHWLKRIRMNAFVGVRYKRIFTLAVMAAKCGISKEELRADADELQKIYDIVGGSDYPFTKSDEESGLKAYTDPYAKRYKYRTMCSFAGLSYTPRDRSRKSLDMYNMRKEAEAMVEGKTYEPLVKITSVDALNLFAREKGWKAQQQMSHRWDENNGRKSKEGLVKEFMDTHPYGNAKQCGKTLGISQQTVNKHWKKLGGSLSDADIVTKWRRNNLQGKQRECIAETGLSRSTIERYWHKIEEEGLPMSVMLEENPEDN